MNATATAPKTGLKSCTCALVVVIDDAGNQTTTGCNASTKRIFAPGHDARLKGFLIRAGVEGHSVKVGQDKATTAQAVADQFGFGYMVAAGIKAGAERAFKAELKAMAKAAKKSHETPKQVTCKVGRWTYEGVITDSPMHGPQFTYTTAKGVQTTTTRFTKI